jgi:ATP-binding protein involved in chromosome partitioning
LSEHQHGPDADARAKEEQEITTTLGRIKHKILVMSGKGGVGKSTVAVNVAVALQRAGHKVGLLDVDLHGPTAPVLLGMREARPDVQGEKLLPMPHSSGVGLVSMGNLLDMQDRAVIWRGPKKIGAIRQFIGDVEWGELDYLVIDSPPGTGDEPLTVAQTVTDAQALIVTTPQEVSLADVRKSLNFCETIGMPVLGVVENMSGFICPECGHAEPIFGAGGGSEMARKYGLTFLGTVPIEPAIVRGGDRGKPFVEDPGDSSAGKAFAAIVGEILAHIGKPAPAPAPTREPAEPVAAAAPAEAAPATLDGDRVFVVPIHGGLLTNHFGHAEAMTFVTTRDGKIVDEKTLTPPAHAPGVIPPWAAEQGAHVIIAGGMGSHAQELFQASGVAVVCGAPNLAPRELVQQFLDGKLETGANACDH